MQVRITTKPKQARSKAYQAAGPSPPSTLVEEPALVCNLQQLQLPWLLPLMPVPTATKVSSWFNTDARRTEGPLPREQKVMYARAACTCSRLLTMSQSESVPGVVTDPAAESAPLPSLPLLHPQHPLRAA